MFAIRLPSTSEPPKKPGAVTETLIISFTVLQCTWVAGAGLTIIKIEPCARAVVACVVEDSIAAGDRLEIAGGLLAVRPDIVHPIVRNGIECRIGLRGAISQIGDANARHRTVARERKAIADDGAIAGVLGEEDSVATNGIKEGICDLNVLSILYEDGTRASNGPVAT